ncbi:hypothetical protein MMC30_004628 [Trapelia coarctata]|nr:hypothetical protein [Trapelia coarctata]
MVTLLAILSASTFLYCFAVVIYRVTLHPLAKYPGPFLAKFTDWYALYHTARRDNHLNFHLAHQKYGKFVRFGPNRLAINSNTAWRDIYGFHSNVQKSSLHVVFAEFMGGYNLHLTIDKAQHSHKKRVISQAFSDSNMREMEDQIVRVVNNFLGKLVDGTEMDESTMLPDHCSAKGLTRWSSKRDMADWSDYLAFDVMGTLCFGKSFEMLDKDTNHYILDTLRDATSGLHTIAHMPWLLKFRVNKLLFNKLDQSMNKMKAYCELRADERVKRDSKCKTRDFYTYLLKAKDPDTGQGLSHSELASEAGLLMVAGSDTSAVVISSTLFYLLHNPSTLTELTTEIRSTFDSVELIRSGKQLNSCRYLRACIDEALRFSPPTGGIVSREVLEGGINIDGHYLPKGIDVGTPHYALHHNEEYFPDSFTYKPSRWLVNPDVGITHESVELARSAFCAFSMGPRGCLGKGMAYREISIALARVVWLYDMRLAEGSKLGEGDFNFAKGRRRPGEYQLYDTFASKAHGPEVEFRIRLA